MSLFRQIWLVIIGASSLLLLSFFVVGIITASNVLKSEQAQKNIEAARFVSLQLANASREIPDMVAQAKNLAQGSTYDTVRLLDTKGKILFSREAGFQQGSAPQWFMSLFPIDTPPASLPLRHGNTTVARLELSKQRAPFYDAMWDAVVLLFAWMMGGMVIVGIVCNQVLRRMKKPIDEVVAQAEAIKNREFNPIPVATLPELKPVTMAMNEMMVRLKTLFDAEATRLEEVRRDANVDKLTGLELREAFFIRMQTAIQGEDAALHGHFLIVRLFGLAQCNKIMGREATDALMRDVASVLQQFTLSINAAAAGRINGVDLALFIPQTVDSKALATLIAEQTQAKILAALSKSPQSAALIQQVLFFVGLTTYSKGETQGQILARVDAAIAAVEATGKSGWAQSDAPVGQSANARRHEQWQKLFAQLSQEKDLQRFRLGEFPVRRADGALIHIECPLRVLLPDTQEWVSAGSFMPMAIRLGQTTHLDYAALSLAMKQKTADRPLAVNVSGLSLANASFIEQCEKLFKTSPDKAASLWIEVPETDVYAYFEQFVAFSKWAKNYGAHIGVKHFGHQFSKVPQLHGLGLNYFKIDSSFTHEVNSNVANQAFLSGLCTMSHNIGVGVIATGVKTNEESKMLFQLTVDGLTGPVVK